MIFERNFYLQRLVSKKWNGRIKIITGLRRCGKSYFLFKIFKGHLLSNGVSADCIVELSLDNIENEHLRDPKELWKFLGKRMGDTNKKYYLLLDEIQFAISKKELQNHDEPVRLYGVLNGLLQKGNIDIYVTGSNSKMLSHDVATEFRGRGDILPIYPLSFREFFGAFDGDREVAYETYATFGGMPYVATLKNDEDKREYLLNLFEEIYFKDIEERYSLAYPAALGEITNTLCSAVGSLTNASKIARTIQSLQRKKIGSETISGYLNYLTDSFLFSKAYRYDVKGKKYFDFPLKYYATDVGLRNARLGFRDLEESHIMENIVYNEFKVRGFSVDVGVVPVCENGIDGKRHIKNCEIDFIVSKGIKKSYFQSAYSLNGDEKRNQEIRPLLSVKDFFEKTVITRFGLKPWSDERGVQYTSLLDFLLSD